MLTAIDHYDAAKLHILFLADGLPRATPVGANDPYRSI
jgi:hypothetical protein